MKATFEFDSIEEMQTFLFGPKPLPVRKKGARMSEIEQPQPSEQGAPAPGTEVEEGGEVSPTTPEPEIQTENDQEPDGA